MIIVTGSFIAKEGQIKNALALSLAHVARSRLEPGCLLHTVQVDAENPNRLVFLEEWESMVMLKAHFKVPECVAFVSRIVELAEFAEPLNLFDATRLNG